MASKPKTPQSALPEEPQLRDQFQTPFYATKLIADRIPKNYVIWEPCSGKGKMVRDFKKLGYKVFGTTIEKGQNVLTYEPPFPFNVVVTNPAFSIKKQVYERLRVNEWCFALLIPGDWSQWVWDAVFRQGCVLVVPQRRISYITPTGKKGKESAAQFHSVWLTYGLMYSNNYMDNDPFSIYGSKLSLEDMKKI